VVHREIAFRYAPQFTREIGQTIREFDGAGRVTSVQTCARNERTDLFECTP
jgi:hypothetical protein